jgi:hypothetical protein
LTGDPDALYRNNGDGTFTDVTVQAGIKDPGYYGFGVVFSDFDNDGWQDIYVANDGNPNLLFRNNRNGTFSDVTKSAGLDVELYGMGVAVGDWNNDGFPDLLITCVGQNRLFRNTGKGTFVDVTKASGLAGAPPQHVRPGSTSIATACSTSSSATTSSGRWRTTSSAVWTGGASPTARRRRTGATRAGCSATAATARSRT